MHLRLKELRKERDLTQKVICAEINCSIVAYSKYENGDVEPSIDVLNKLANFYGVSIDYLVGRDVVPSSALTDEEMKLIKKLRNSTDIVRDSAIDFVDLMDNNVRMHTAGRNTKNSDK